MEYREIGADLLARAQLRHREEGTPTVLTLHEAGVFRGAELRGVIRQLGGEVLFDFLRAQEESYFSYRKLDTLPDFALAYDLRLGITPILLETTKRLDDWRTLRSVFPDPRAPIKPMPDMLARIASLTLGVVEIKLLTMIDGENSPEKLAQAIGLPITDVYQLLVQLAREGAIEAAGRFEGIDHAVHNVQDSLQAAFDALDANDDVLAVESALDRVLGGDLGVGPRSGANSRFHLR